MFTLTFTFRKFQKMLTVLYKYITDQKKKCHQFKKKLGFFSKTMLPVQLRENNSRHKYKCIPFNNLTVSLRFIK